MRASETATGKPAKHYRWPGFVLAVAVVIVVWMGVCSFQAPAAVRFTIDNTFTHSIQWLVGLVTAAVALVVPTLFGLVGLVIGRRRLISLLTLLICLVGAPVTLYSGASMGVEILKTHALALVGDTYANLGGASGIIEYALGQLGVGTPQWLNALLTLAGS